MATIGLDKLYYAKITEAENGEETYAQPQQLAKAMSADLSVELAEATLYADDGAAEIAKEFKSGKLTLGIDDIGSAVASDLTGANIIDAIESYNMSLSYLNMMDCVEIEVSLIVEGSIEVGGGFL